jgi:energy-converting hydrogenase B subunit D
MIQLVLGVLFVVVLVTAIVAIEVRDLLAASVVLSGFSFMMALLYALLGAVDVGFNEAVLGAGVTGVLFVVAVLRTARGTVD